MRRTFTLLATVLASLLTVLVPSGPAAADEHLQRTFTEGYADSGTIRFNTPSICVAWTMSGVKSYRGHYIHRDPATGPDTYSYLIESVKLTTNSLTLRAFKPNGSTCPNTDAKYWNEVKVEAHARGHKCSFNPSISASLGFPASFGLGLEFWPTCQDKAKTFLKATVGAGHVVTVRNDPQVLTFASQELTYGSPNNNVPWNCYGVNFGFQIDVGNNHNVNTAIGPRIEACPNWKGTKSAF